MRSKLLLISCYPDSSSRLREPWPGTWNPSRISINMLGTGSSLLGGRSRAIERFATMTDRPVLRFLCFDVMDEYKLWLHSEDWRIGRVSWNVFSSTKPLFRCSTYRCFLYYEKINRIVPFAKGWHIIRVDLYSLVTWTTNLKRHFCMSICCVFVAEMIKKLSVLLCCTV